MKKAIVYTISIMVVLAFSACNKDKDGIYLPDKRISKVYYSKDSNNDNISPISKFMKEQWHWKGKKVSSIDYYDESGSLNYTFKFEYDGKQLEKMKMRYPEYEEDYVIYFKFSYDGKWLSKIELYASNSGEDLLVREGTVTNDGSHITEITWRVNGKKEPKSKRYMKMTESAMQLLFPYVGRECTEQRLIKNGAKESYGWTEKYTWDGDNISEIESIEGSNIRTTRFHYDSKMNPLYGFYGYYGSDEDCLSGITSPYYIYSKNNVVSAEGQLGKDELEYKYDGDWPTEQSYTYIFTDSTYYKWTLYYEYEN